MEYIWSSCAGRQAHLDLLQLHGNRHFCAEQPCTGHSQTKQSSTNTHRQSGECGRQEGWTGSHPATSLWTQQSLRPRTWTQNRIGAVKCYLHDTKRGLSSDWYKIQIMRAGEEKKLDGEAGHSLWGVAATTVGKQKYLRWARLKVTCPRLTVDKWMTAPATCETGRREK